MHSTMGAEEGLEIPHTPLAPAHRSFTSPPCREHCAGGPCAVTAALGPSACLLVLLAAILLLGLGPTCLPICVTSITVERFIQWAPFVFVLAAPVLLRLRPSDCRVRKCCFAIKCQCRSSSSNASLTSPLV